MIFILLSGYIASLAMLGPYHALHSKGCLDLLPQTFRALPYYIATPVYSMPVLRTYYDDYLQAWNWDANEPDRPAGWI